MKHAHSYKKLTPETFRALREENKEFLLVDTLPYDHFTNAHLPGAVNACVYEMNFVEQVHGIASSRSTPIVVYGASSNSLDSRTAAEKLSMAGYSDVSVLEGGIDRWRQAGYSLEGSAPDKDQILLPESRLENGDYQILPQESKVGWTGRNPNTSHFGTVAISGGSLSIRDTVIQGNVTVDMDSIENISLAGNELQPVLISHLKSDDFFFVDAFPAARLNIRSGRFSHIPYPSRPNCEITGTLELRGLQNDLSFAAIVTKGTDGNLHLCAHFDMDRTFWGITYGSGRFYEHLGMHTVFDNISIELLIVATRES